MAANPYILRPDEHLQGENPGVKASGQSTGGSISLVDSTATGGAPLHIHRDEDECFFVIDGTITVRCGEHRWTAGPGAFVFLPRNIPHSWDVDGEQARLLIITTPGGFEEFLRRFHEASPEERDGIAEQFGITFLLDEEW